MVGIDSCDGPVDSDRSLVDDCEALLESGGGERSELELPDPWICLRTLSSTGIRNLTRVWASGDDTDSGDDGVWGS